MIDKIEQNTYNAKQEKPYRGRIANWRKLPFEPRIGEGLGYCIGGTYLDHPYFAGETGRTSFVVAHNKKTGYIETRNSRYKLVGKELTEKHE